MAKHNENSFQLNRKMIIGAMGALATHSFALIGSAWAIIRNMDTAIQRNTYDIVELKEGSEETLLMQHSYTAHKARSENKFDNLSQGQQRIEKKLDRLIERN